MPVSVTNNPGSLSIDTGGSIVYPNKKKVMVWAVGNNVRISWDENSYVEFPYTDFTAPTGASASAVASSIENFLDTGI